MKPEWKVGDRVQLDIPKSMWDKTYAILLKERGERGYWDIRVENPPYAGGENQICEDYAFRLVDIPAINI